MAWRTENSLESHLEDHERASEHSIVKNEPACSIILTQMV